MNHTVTWTPTTQQLPPDGEVVETKDEINYPDITLLLYYVPIWKDWIGGYPKGFTPTHWRQKERKDFNI